MTVLFADLVGFTSLSERLDAEDVAMIQDAYFAAVRDAVARHGGQLEKFIGDAAMAVYGVPRGRDDDAERAVRTGLALVEAVERLGARLDLDDGGLRLRVGVNTGEVVYAVDGPDAGRVTGDTVNTAARLQAAAEPGGVLVGEATALTVAEAIEVEAVRALSLKGKAAPVRAFRAVGVRPQRSRDLAMGSLHAPTIGRDDQLSALDAALERTAGARKAERWLVVAPPGVGKTRLVDAFGRRATGREPPPLVWRIRLRPEAGAPFDPLGPLVTQALREASLRLDQPAASGALRARLVVGGLPEARAAVVAGELLPLAGAAPSRSAGPPRLTERAALFGAWLEGLDVLAAGRAQVWLVEDLHWAGPDLVAFLDAATAASGLAGRLIVATARPSFIEAVPAWGLDDPSGTRRVLELATLPAPDATTLVHELVGDALPDRLVASIVERSDGNCLFIEELLRTWVGTGALVPARPVGSRGDGTRGTWRLAVTADEAPLPATVQAIYAAQLDDLPAPARLAARRGAVAGRRFPLDALASLGVAGSAGAVEELKRRALVGGPIADPLVGDSYAYRHALLRDAGYASLARAERAELHVRLARWLEVAAGASPDRAAAAIGQHLATALASAPALSAQVAPGLARDACADEAAAWLERAADRALADTAAAAAADLYRRAAAITGDGRRADRSRRLTRLGGALAPIGGVDEAIGVLRAAIADARAARLAGDATWRTRFAQATEALAGLLYEQLRFVEAWRLGEDALAEMGDAGDLDAARVRLAAARGRSGETNDTGRWVIEADRAVAAARAAGDPEAEWAFERDRARARSEAGLATVQDWLALGERARSRGDASVEVAARTNEAAWRMATAPRDVPALLAPARELAVTRGLVERLGWIEHAEAEAALGAGDWTLAIEAGIRAVELGDRHGYDRIAVRSWAALLPAAWWRGQAAVLQRARVWFQARSGHLPDSPYGRVLYAGTTRWLGPGGERGPVAPPFDRIQPAFTQWLPNGSYEWMAAGDAVLDAWFDANRLDWIGQALDEIMAVAADDEAPAARLDAAQHRARHALRRADRASRSPALDAVRSGLRELRALGLPLWIARGLRILEEAGGATAAESAERASIELALGVVRPTL